MKKFIKGLTLLVIILIAGLTIFIVVQNEDLPTGDKGEKAEQLAQNILKAINLKAFEIGRTSNE